MTTSKNLIAKARHFANYWKNITKERAEKDTFWNEFFDIFGIDRKKVAQFEFPVQKDNNAKSFIDIFWKGRLIGEHKSAGRDLNKAEKQALGYIEQLKADGFDERDLPKYLIVSDFATVRLVHLDDLGQATGEQVEFPLGELHRYLANFNFMLGMQSEVKEAEELANIKAAEEIGKLYDVLQENNYEEHALKMLIIRLLFCFFAEDTGIFNPLQFEQYIKNSRKDGSDLGERLHWLFNTLNKPEDKRMKNLSEELNAFPYVNGGLFADNMDLAIFDEKMRNQLIDCVERDWSQISPEIFGSLFQSVMDAQQRRELGAHYTEESNILKVINSLFLDELEAEFEALQKERNKAKRQENLLAFQEKLGNLTFLDPACGCGNFLVVAYRELRALELKVIAELYEEQSLLDVETMLKCHIGQFHGIELEEYPVQIARVAMWLTDHQCNLKMAERFGKARPTIPLTDTAHIQVGNALSMDWVETDYILGNPPFIGSSMRNAEQQADVALVMPKDKKFGKMDYVACWYVKAAKLMLNHPQTKTAFVSTNSICQGEQAGILWKWLFEQGFFIQFAHRTFQWTSSAKGKAAVHCIIVGFGLENIENKALFIYPDIKEEPICLLVKNINQYLVNGANVFIPSRSKVAAGIKQMTRGNKPWDGGNLILSSSEKQELSNKYPKLIPYIRPFIGSDELINGKERYCLWFADTPNSLLNEFSRYPEIKERKEGVKATRLKSPTPSTVEWAEKPFLFTQNRQPKTNFLAVPEVSSENRHYIPMDFLSADNVPSNKIYMIADVETYVFGILMSTMHMAWVRIIAGRLESRYSYSPNVYHSFPFPNVDKDQKEKIEKLAQAVLDTRKKLKANDPKATLATLYNPDTMPEDLRKAHKKLDAAVDATYRKQKFNDESERVGFLLDLYQKMVGEK